MRHFAFVFATLLLVGCNAQSTSSHPAREAENVAETTNAASSSEVTLYLAGMNKRLKIL